MASAQASHPMRHKLRSQQTSISPPPIGPSLSSQVAAIVQLRVTGRLANHRYDSWMSDSPLGGVPAGQAAWMPPAPVQKASQVPVIIAIVVSLLALGLAAAAFFKPKHDDAPAAPQYSEQQVADAKKNLCDAYKLSINAIQTAGRTTSEDPNQKYMLALNTRLAFNTAADYLANESSTQIAAPSALLDQFHSLVGTYRKMVLILTTEAAKADTDAIFAEVDSHESAIQKECG